VGRSESDQSPQPFLGAHLRLGVPQFEVSNGDDYQNRYRGNQECSEDQILDEVDCSDGEARSASYQPVERCE